MSTFVLVPDRPNFPKEEETILKFWNDHQIFERSAEKAKGRPLFSFYDGPPFATGLPHYGHILAGTIKDIVTRYAYQTGHAVERRFGWDCHGLPIEFEIDKELGISTHDEVVQYGIAEYNERCRSIVMRYASQWETAVKRVGRWIDFRNDYRTMNLPYMETVWWVFKNLFDKGMVYKAFKVMPYSTGCSTPLSNFEANLNYKDVQDPAVVISFPFQSDPSVEFLAWTTTPWTLPSNLALSLHPEFIYVKFQCPASNDKTWVMAESRLEWFCQEMKLKMEDISILEKHPGVYFRARI